VLKVAGMEDRHKLKLLLEQAKLAEIPILVPQVVVAPNVRVEGAGSAPVQVSYKEPEATVEEDVGISGSTAADPIEIPIMQVPRGLNRPSDDVLRHCNIPLSTGRTSPEPKASAPSVPVDVDEPMSGEAPEAEDVPMVPGAAVSEEPPAAPMAPPVPEVFLVPEVPVQEVGADVSGSTAMDVEPEASETPASGDVAMSSAPAAMEEPAPDVPAASSHAAVNLAELIQGTATSVPAHGQAYFSDTELGLDKTRGARHDLKPGWDS
jgi:hypothetical protein